MPSHKADRVAAQRAAQAREKVERKRDEAAAAKHAEINEFASRSEELIPQVLNVLAERGYPDIQEIDVYVPRSGLGRLLGQDRLTKAGAYRVAPYSYGESHSRPAGTDYVRLLPSGRIVVGTGSHSLSEYVQQVLNSEGLGEPGRGNDLEAFSLRGLSRFVDGLADLLDTNS